MFINATQLTQSRAPSDASAVAFQVAIKQQKEFEEALKHAQDRRDAEAAAKQAQALAREKAARAEAAKAEKPDAQNTESQSNSGDNAEPSKSGDTRGAAVDVEV